MRLSTSSCWCLVLLCLACVGQALAGRRNGQLWGTEISSSVIITGFNDLEGDAGSGRTPCELAVHNSQGNAKKINFVLTLNAVGEQRTLYRYYFKDNWGKLIPADAGSIARFKAGLEKCFKAGIDAGFTTLHLLPHIDPREHTIDGKGLWRNVVNFDPLAKYGPDSYSAFSYEDVLLQPAAEALNAVVRDDTVVEFTLSAEQGLSVWSFPRAYIKLLQSTKATIARGKNAATRLFGVSFNYDKICGCVEPEEKDPIRYNNTYVERFARFQAAGGLKKIDVEGVKELFDKSDFIGISSYAPLPAELTLASMEVSIQTVAFELKSFGIDLNSYIFGKDKQLIYSEQGLGGCSENRQVAPSLDFVRVHPFWGDWPAYGYTSSVDPWKNDDYKQYRRQLYRLLSTWASQGGGPQYKIDGIFLWSVGTWDVNGIHPRTTANGGSYADDVIRNYIRQGNAVANQQQPGQGANVKQPANAASAVQRKPQSSTQPPASVVTEASKLKATATPRL